MALSNNESESQRNATAWKRWHASLMAGAISAGYVAESAENDLRKLKTGWQSASESGAAGASALALARKPLANGESLASWKLWHLAWLGWTLTSILQPGKLHLKLHFWSWREANRPVWEISGWSISRPWRKTEMKRRREEMKRKSENSAERGKLLASKWKPKWLMTLKTISQWLKAWKAEETLKLVKLEAESRRKRNASWKQKMTEETLVENDNLYSIREKYVAVYLAATMKWLGLVIQWRNGEETLEEKMKRNVVKMKYNTYLPVESISKWRRKAVLPERNSGGEGWGTKKKTADTQYMTMQWSYRRS